METAVMTLMMRNKVKTLNLEKMARTNMTMRIAKKLLNQPPNDPSTEYKSDLGSHVIT